MIEYTSTGSILKDYIIRLEENSFGIKFSAKVCLMGGAIRRAMCGHSLEEGDFDIYFFEYKDLETYTENLERGSKLAVSKSTKGEWGVNFITTFDLCIDKLNVQLHHMQNPGIKDVSSAFKTFDFTCCQFAYDGEKIRYLDTALDDAKKHILRYTGFAGTFTVSRAFRFMSMGFKPTKQTLLDLQKLSIDIGNQKGRKPGRS